MKKINPIMDKLQELKEKAWRRPVFSPRSRFFARRYADKTKGLIDKGMKAVGQEAGETEEMARSFFKLLEAKLDLSGRKEPPTEEEVKAAIEQLKDMGRFTLFTTMVILPGGVVSLVGLELLARKFGISNFNLIPSSFRKKKHADESKNNPEPAAPGSPNDPALHRPESPEGL